jgi:hypothetical protein
MNFASNYKYIALVLVVIVMWFAWPCIKKNLMPSCDVSSTETTKSSSEPTSSNNVVASSTPKENKETKTDSKQSVSAIEAKYKDVTDNDLYEEVVPKST